MFPTTISISEPEIVPLPDPGWVTVTSDPDTENSTLPVEPPEYVPVYTPSKGPAAVAEPPSHDTRPTTKRQASAALRRRSPAPRVARLPMRNVMSPIVD